MIHLIQDWGTALAMHSHWLLILIFLAALGEGVVFIGIFLPSTVIMLALGGIAGPGLFWPMVIAGGTGAIIGEAISYWIGLHYQQRIYGIWPFSRQPELMQATEKFFRRYGVFSMALARFVPVLRPVFAVFAGVARMPSNLFYISNIGSAFIWSALTLAPGTLARWLFQISQ